MASNALTTAGRFRFVASDRTGRPWTTLSADRGVRISGSGSNITHTSMNPNAKIVLTTRPTALQDKAFKLLGANPACTQ